jgi:uncharacterized membrane protein
MRSLPFVTSVVLLTLSLGTAAHAAEYSISELPTPAGLPRCNASRINDLGQVVGGCWGRSPSTERAVLWANGQVTVLPQLPGFTSSSASTVSPTGEIVGSAQGPSGLEAMLWSNGGVQELPNLPDTSLTLASDVNASGVIVGFSDNHAVEWINGQILDFGGYNGDRPQAINDRGVFVGFGVINDGDVGGAIIDVGTPGAPLRYLVQSSLGAAYAINEYGEVAGFNRSGADAPDVPWTWQYGSFTYLPFLAGTTSCIPNGVDRLGRVVGLCSLRAAVATLWKHGEASNLNSLIQKNSHWVLWAATTINSSGEIVGDGLYNDVEEAYILHPNGNVR